jgi:hypothetical protein
MPATIHGSRSALLAAAAGERAAPPIVVPHSAQNLARAESLAPQEGQARLPRVAPHSEQNLPEVWAPQAGHFTVAEDVMRES